MGQDWFGWHNRYDTTEAYQQRLACVQGRVREHLDGSPPGEVVLISMCAGQGRDVAAALEGHPRRPDLTGLLVELDRRNVEVANKLLAEAGVPGIRAVAGDASTASAYADVAPADIVLACGIFGNIADDDVETTCKSIAMLCRPNATVIWTRHRAKPDLTPAIRRWFTEAGFKETGFDAMTAGPQSVGAQRLVADPLPFNAETKFFEFVTS